MTPEEKQLLLTALCGYLPYKVKCFAEDREYGDLGTLYSIDPFENLDPNIYIQYDKGNVISFFTSEIKPYLRPMSSMTDEEKREYYSFIGGQQPFDFDFSAYPTEYKFIYEWDVVNYVKWLNSHHLDYLGLIEKDLAIKAPNGMYEI